MAEKKRYIQLKDLEVYKHARELSRLGWEMYKSFDWQTKKVIGDQFITATDSVGANIAEGYSRYHYLDRIKFFYNSRGSLAEAADHWLAILHERGKIDDKQHEAFALIASRVSLKLQNFINAIYKTKNSE
ncbi:MAG TPA: four helix bundle protein [Candidatus Paceibacterota bacterium]